MASDHIQLVTQDQQSSSDGDASPWSVIPPALLRPIRLTLILAAILGIVCVAIFVMLLASLVMLNKQQRAVSSIETRVRALQDSIQSLGGGRGEQHENDKDASDDKNKNEMTVSIPSFRPGGKLPYQRGKTNFNADEIIKLKCENLTDNIIEMRFENLNDKINGMLENVTDKIINKKSGNLTDNIIEMKLENLNDKINGMLDNVTDIIIKKKCENITDDIIEMRFENLNDKINGMLENVTDKIIHKKSGNLTDNIIEMKLENLNDKINGMLENVTDIIIKKKCENITDDIIEMRFENLNDKINGMLKNVTDQITEKKCENLTDNIIAMKFENPNHKINEMLGNVTDKIIEKKCEYLNESQLNLFFNSLRTCITEEKEQFSFLANCLDGSSVVTNENDKKEQFVNDSSSTLISMFCIDGTPCQSFQYQAKHCYKFMKDPLSWDRASLICSEMGGYLVEIDSPQEMQVIRNYHSSLGGTDERLHEFHELWFGGTDNDKEGKWIWKHSGRPITLAAWGEGEPNNIDDEDCLQFILSSGTWNDNSCDRHLPFLCERETKKGEDCWDDK